MIATFRSISWLMLATAITLVSCGGDSGAGEQRIIRFWHFWSEPGQKAALQELAKEFERANDCTVELSELSWNDGKAKLQAAFNSGAPPDVVELGSDWVAQFSSAGVLQAVTPTDTLTGRFVANSLAPAQWNGKIYALPWTLDTRVLYVNTAMLANAGWKGGIATMDDVLGACRAVQDKGAYGYAANGADKHRLYKKILPLMWTYGGDLFDSATGRPVLNSPANVRALTVYADLARTGFIETQRQLDAAFLQGRVAVWNSGSWLLKKLRNTPGLQVQALMMPGTDGRPGVSFAGGEYLAVSAASPRKQLAEKFVDFLTDGKNSVQFCAKVDEAGFPADKQYRNDPRLIADPMKKVFAEQLQYARLTPVHARWLDVESILEDAVTSVLLGEATPAAALDFAQSEVLQLSVK